MIWINTLRPRQNGSHFADDIFKCIFLNGNVWISTDISLKFVPRGPIDNIPALVHIMAWRRLGDKPLSEPMMVSLVTHICITRPQWVKFTSTSGETVLRWMPQNTSDRSASALVQVMTWCHQATKDYLNQCWPRHMASQGHNEPTLSDETYHIGKKKASCWDDIYKGIFLSVSRVYFTWDFPG